MPRCVLTPLAALALILVSTATAGANAPAKPQRTFEQHITLTPLGDATVRLKWNLPAVEYATLQYRLGTPGVGRDKDGKMVPVRNKPSPESLHHFFNLSNLDVATKDVKVTADDTKHEITATFKIDGWARTTGATTWAVVVLDNARWYDLLTSWTAPVAAKRDFATTDGAPAGTLRYSHTDTSDLTNSVVRGEVKLPVGAKAAKLEKRDDGRWAVTYRLAKPAGKGDEDAEIAFTVSPRREIIPAYHKLYSDALWTTYYLARTTFSNPTNDTVTNVKVRARLTTSAGQTAWSEWEEVAAAVYPGGSAQFALTPVLDAKALMLTSKENAKLSVELEYTVGDKKTTRARTARLAVLGQNDAAYSNIAPGAVKDVTFYHHFQEGPVLMASFVTPNDPIVKDLKGLLSAHIGGQATFNNDAGAEKFAKALYDFFRANITYSSPSSSETEDGKLLQHINYTRNVLKNGTGTCIDLAVAYASVAEAAGMKAGVCIIPGHALPYIHLPQSGRLLFIDVVCCRNGKMEGSDTWAQALRAGQAHIDKDHPRVFGYLPRLRKRVSAPELAKIDVVNPLTTWGRKMPPLAPEAALGRITVKHNVVNVGGTRGMQLSVPYGLINGKSQEAELVLSVVKADGTSFLDSDQKPVEARLTLKPKSDKLFQETVTFHYPYTAFGAKADGNWAEFGLRVGVWSKVHNEEASITPVADRLMVQLTAPAKAGDAPVARSVVFVTRTAQLAGKLGVELIVKDVQTAGGVPLGTTTNVALAGSTWKVLTKADGKDFTLAANGVGHNSLWFGDEDMVKAGSAKAGALGMVMNFYDPAKKDWLMPKAVLISVKR